MVNLTAHALLFTIAAIGISETSYLIRKRIAAEQPVCPIGENCYAVLSSKYNRTLGVHNDILGMLFYIAFAFIVALLVIGAGDPALWLKLAGLMLAGASAMSAFLIYVQWKIIRAWCFWCLMSATTVGLMDLILIASKSV
jgi:uncharacterized membrane protein